MQSRVFDSSDVWIAKNLFKKSTKEVSLNVNIF